MTSPTARVAVEPVIQAIAGIDPDQLNDREVVAYLAGISEAVTGLVVHRPDLKAHADLVMDLANRVFAGQVRTEAEQAVIDAARRWRVAGITTPERSVALALAEMPVAKEALIAAVDALDAVPGEETRTDG